MFQKHASNLPQLLGKAGGALHRCRQLFHGGRLLAGSAEGDVCRFGGAGRAHSLPDLSGRALADV